MSSFSYCKLLLEQLDGKKDAPTLEQKIDKIIDEIKDLNIEDKKIEFISEQLNLMFKAPRGRRYSVDVLAMAQF